MLVVKIIFECCICQQRRYFMFVRSGRERRAWYSRKYQKKSQAIINADAIRSVKERMILFVDYAAAEEQTGKQPLVPG